MQKERSKGVTFWGWAFIILSIIGISAEIMPRQESQLYGIGMHIFSMVLSVAYFICGIFILKLNEVARKAAIILGIISIISIPSFLNPVINKTMFDDYYRNKKKAIFEQIKPEYHKKAMLELNEKLSDKVIPVIFMVIFGIPILILDLIPIYFFTRPKVKEQFKALKEAV